MAYFRAWRKRNAEVVALPEDSTDGEDALHGMWEDGISVKEDGASPPLTTAADDDMKISQILYSYLTQNLTMTLCLMNPLQKKLVLIWVRNLLTGPPEMAASGLH
ncbi:hypothetical protein ATANTOWER_024824 [Ataeniobius toweri]|uniref:Uncharacterized protein n=1 Tax=Ataeniobius toweri TaxID=208326 RepID=A0ABU7AZL9_9TELE|nr:hypothetical protein [Ataeniobius toweri]